MSLPVGSQTGLVVSLPVGSERGWLCHYQWGLRGIGFVATRGVSDGFGCVTTRAV